LQDLAFSVTDWEALNQEHARLAHAAALLEGAELALEAISEGEAPLGGEAERIAAKLGELAGYDNSLGEIAELISDAAIRLDEAAHALRRYRDKVDLDPARLNAAEQRIEAVVSLARKYRVSPEKLAELLARSLVQLDSLTQLADPAALLAREAAAKLAFTTQAQRLSAGRAQAAHALSLAVSETMQELAMAGGRFEIALLPEPEGSAVGFERIEFQVAANPNQPLRALSKVASGGELSRIGLAIQVITSESQSTPTLIFDEVDSGIGGRVAEIVGRRLRELGHKRQVLCVTHLPQVAAQANWQWRVLKEMTGTESISRLIDLDEAGRVEEIARMLGGVNITETTRSHAAELLAQV